MIKKHRKRSRYAKWRHFVNNVLQTNWGIECLKALLVSIMLLFVSTTAVWVITNLSPGEYSGTQLDRYLLKCVAKDTGDLYVDTNYVIDRKIIKEDEQIVICGKYRLEHEVDYTGRFIYIFERQKKNFWNALAGTRPSFKPVLSLISNDDSYARDQFRFIDCTYDNIDDYDKDEIIVSFQNVYADRKSTAYLILQFFNDSWNVVCPDFSSVEQELVDLGITPTYVYIDPFYFSRINSHHHEVNTIVVYGQTSSGYIQKLDNPFWQGYDWLYCIMVNDTDNGFLLPNKQVFVMERLTNHGMFRDPNWNLGSILCVSLADENIEDTIDSLWGFRTDSDSDIVFYGLDVE